MNTLIVINRKNFFKVIINRRTLLIRAYLKGVFSDEYKMTIGIYYFTNEIILDI